MRYVVLDGKAYSWKQLLQLRREQRERERKERQPTLFELREDHRPRSQKTASDRYLQPTLFGD